MKIILQCICIPLLGASIWAQGLTDERNGLQVSGVKWFVETFTRLVPVDGNSHIRGTLGAVDPMDLQLRSDRYFVYETTFKNTSGKRIRGILWDHVFSSKEDGRVLKNHRFYYLVPIAKGGSRKVRNTMDVPPTPLVGADDLKKDAISPYRQEVAVKCVVFEGNVTWKNAGIEDKECEELRLNIWKREEKLKKYY